MGNWGQVKMVSTSGVIGYEFTKITKNWLILALKSSNLNDYGAVPLARDCNCINLSVVVKIECTNQ